MRTELKPFIECSIVQRVVPFSSVKQFKYMTVLIQEFHVKVDLLFINAIVAMVSQEPTEETMVSDRNGTPSTAKSSSKRFPAS